MRKVEALTPVQLDVALLIADGESPQRIRNFLGMSMSTFENHRARTYEKLGVKHKRELETVIRLEVGR